MNNIEITAEQMEGYEVVRTSGLTNMWDVPTVIRLADSLAGIELTEEVCLEIMKNYSTYKEKFLNGKEAK